MGQRVSFALLLFLSGPVLLDWADHVITHTWAWYVIPFVFLTPLAIHRSSPRGDPHGILAVCIVAAGFSIQLWAVASGVTRFARPGFVLCVIGVLLLYGRARFRNIVMLALCVPVPDFLIDRVGHISLPALASVFASADRLFGVSAVAIGPKIELPTRTIYLLPTDLGLTTGALAFGLSWYACLLFRLPLGQSIFIGAMAGASGVIIHWIGTAVLLVTRSLDAGGRTPRDFAVYLTVVVATAVAWGVWRASRGAGPMAAPMAPQRGSPSPQAAPRPTGRGQD